MCDSVCTGDGFVFFFFKQKTAYEMRISDWSSDVCSSDLLHRGILDVSGVGEYGPVVEQTAGGAAGRRGRSNRSQKRSAVARAEVGPPKNGSDQCDQHGTRNAQHRSAAEFR